MLFQHSTSVWDMCVCKYHIVESDFLVLLIINPLHLIIYVSDVINEYLLMTLFLFSFGKVLIREQIFHITVSSLLYTFLTSLVLF